MKKYNYEILRKNVPSVKLVSLTGQTWYDSNDNIVTWSGSFHSGSVYIGPNQSDIVYNITGSVSTGYYQWSGTTWTSVSKSYAYESYNLPIFLENNVDEMGVMVGFDGDMTQIEQVVNFTYSGFTGSTQLYIYNSVNPNSFRSVLTSGVTYTINWGDGSTSGITVNDGIIGNNFPSVSHTYVSGDTYNVSITLDSPWTTQKLFKKITVPLKDWNDIDNVLGTYTFTGATIPLYNVPTNDYIQSGRTQDYLNDLDFTNNTGYTSGYTGFTYLSLGRSRISEKKLYGSNSYTGITTGVTDNVNWSGYTFTYSGDTSLQTIYYRDYEDGYTLITGTTTGYTREEVFNSCLTRNEHFLGFVDEPTIYSDVFVERGKQGVMENNFRLGEIDNTGELDIYGNGYFKIRKQ